MNLLLLVLAVQNPESLSVRFAGMTAVTGYEQSMTDSLLALLPGSSRDRIGNVTLVLGRGSPRRLVYCALDEIGYAVGNITDDGYILLRRVGGGARLYPLFDQQIEGHRVTLFGRRGAVPGVVAVRSTHLTVTCDHDFSAVIDGCSEPGPKRARTWINAPIRKLYRGLFEIGHCHTVEVYDGDALVGGLYGVSLGRAFFGESMFHRVRDASKIALVHLVARLKLGRFELLDTQFTTDHLETFGTTEVSQERYGRLLASATRQSADVSVFKRALSGAEALALARG